MNEVESDEQDINQKANKMKGLISDKHDLEVEDKEISNDDGEVMVLVQWLVVSDIEVVVVNSMSPS